MGIQTVLSGLCPINLSISADRQKGRNWVCISSFTIAETKYQMLGHLKKKKRVYLGHNFGTVGLSCIRLALVRAPLAVSLCGKSYRDESTCKRERLYSETESQRVGASLAPMRAIKTL